MVIVTSIFTTPTADAFPILLPFSAAKTASLYVSGINLYNERVCPVRRRPVSHSGTIAPTKRVSDPVQRTTTISVSEWSP